MRYKLTNKKLKEIIGNVAPRVENKQKIKDLLNKHFQGNKYGKVERRMQVKNGMVLLGFQRYKGKKDADYS